MNIKLEEHNYSPLKNWDWITGLLIIIVYIGSVVITTLILTLPVSASEVTGTLTATVIEKPTQPRALEEVIIYQAKTFCEPVRSQSFFGGLSTYWGLWFRTAGWQI
jgi:hypothetical protein